MTHIIRAALFGGLMLAAAPAHAALTVVPGLTVHNKCPWDLAIAVRYKDVRGHWTTSGFTTVLARQRKERVISSDNSVFYYYAENSRGNRWSGNRNVQVEGKTYPMKETRLSFNRTRNSFTLGLICTR
jgi:hypothetical protein